MFDAVKQLKTLKARKNELLTENEKLFATAAAAGRGLTDDEKRQYDSHAEQLDTLAGDLLRLERLMAADREAVFEDERPAVEAANGDRRCGFRDVGEFAVSVRHAILGGRPDARLARIQAAPSGYMSEGGSAGEGYLVPPQFRQEIFEAINDVHDVVGMVDTEPTESNAVEMIADESTPWGATGVQAYWRVEAGQMTPSKQASAGRIVKLHELYAFVLATDELLSDAPRLADRLTRKAALAIRYKASDALVNADGVGKPLGWTKSNALVTVSKESGQAANTFVAANAAKMFARLIPSSLARAVWLVNPEVLPQLFTMTLGQNSIFVPPGVGFTQAPGGFLLGRPVIPCDYPAALSSAGDVQFVDPKGYYAPSKSGVQFASSIHLYFDYGLQAFRWTFRIGGQPFLSAAISPAKGSATRSHFVTLEAR